MRSVASTPVAGGMSTSFRALRHRDFRFFWTGALVSNIGSWMQNAAVPYVVFELTDSTTLVGLTAFLQMIPVVFVGPWSGPLADRVDRRRLLLLTQALMALLAFGLWGVWASGWESVPALMALIALSGVVAGVNTPAWQAFVPSLVPRDDLLNAVALNSAQFNAGRAIGPAMAGAVLVTLGPSWAFFLNALSFAGVIFTLWVIRRPPPERRPVSGGSLRQFAEGVRYVRASPEILACMLLVLAVAGLGQPIVQLLPVYAERVFDVGGGAYGVLAGAIGAGATVAVPLLGWLEGLRRSRLLAGSIIGYGALLVGFAQAPGFLLAVALITMAGMAFLAVVSTLQTTVQLLVDEALRGRVMAVYVMAFTAAYPVGSLLQGWVADHLGAPTTTTVAGLALVALAGVLASTPWFDRFDRPTPVEADVELVEP